MTLNQYVNQIVIELKVRMEQSELFPFDDGTRYAGRKPRPQFKPHARNVALKNNPIYVLSPNVQVFELGNERAERVAPHYHILEDAKRIMNPYRGTKATRGSQRLVKDRQKRDYSVEIQGKSYTGLVQEYRLPFKEGRRDYARTQGMLLDKNFESRNERKPYRYNVHYAYIERILEKETPLIAKSLDIYLVSQRGLNKFDPVYEMMGDMTDNNLIGGLEI